MSHFKDYKFFRSLSTRAERWPMRKAEQFWRRLRERKIAGERDVGLRRSTLVPGARPLVRFVFHAVGRMDTFLTYACVVSLLLRDMSCMLMLQ